MELLQALAADLSCLPARMLPPQPSCVFPRFDGIAAAPWLPLCSALSTQFACQFLQELLRFCDTLICLALPVHWNVLVAGTSRRRSFVHETPKQEWNRDQRAHAPQLVTHGAGCRAPFRQRGTPTLDRVNVSKCSPAAATTAESNLFCAIVKIARRSWSNFNDMRHPLSRRRH